MLGSYFVGALEFGPQSLTNWSGLSLVPESGLKGNGTMQTNKQTNNQASVREQKLVLQCSILTLLRTEACREDDSIHILKAA